MSVQGEFFDIASREHMQPDTESRADRERQRRGLHDFSIPKLYRSISEVSSITGIEQYVLRYWETEFEELAPQKNRAGNRVYSDKDISVIQHIKELLRDRRFTIEGAKKILQEERDLERRMHAAETKNDTKDESQLHIIPPPPPKEVLVPIKVLEDLKAELKALKDALI
jgi:DNA-binding transcriptional MerR regulator